MYHGFYSSMMNIPQIVHTVKKYQLIIEYNGLQRNKQITNYNIFVYNNVIIIIASEKNL